MVGGLRNDEHNSSVLADSEAQFGEEKARCANPTLFENVLLSLDCCLSRDRVSPLNGHVVRSF